MHVGITCLLSESFLTVCILYVVYLNFLLGIGLMSNFKLSDQNIVVNFLQYPSLFF